MQVEIHSEKYHWHYLTVETTNIIRDLLQICSRFCKVSRYSFVY